jgi:hypothetical protein
MQGKCAPIGPAYGSHHYLNALGATRDHRRERYRWVEQLSLRAAARNLLATAGQKRCEPQGSRALFVGQARQINGHTQMLREKWYEKVGGKQVAGRCGSR